MGFKVIVAFSTHDWIIVTGLAQTQWCISSCSLKSLHPINIGLYVFVAIVIVSFALISTMSDIGLGLDSEDFSIIPLSINDLIFRHHHIFTGSTNFKGCVGDRFYITTAINYTNG